MRTFNGHQPWELQHRPRSLVIRLAAYRRAMWRSPKWSGRLAARRRELRFLAREIGPEAEERLELLLELMQAAHAELWRDGPPDPQAPVPRVSVRWAPEKWDRASQLLPALRPFLPTSSEQAPSPEAKPGVPAQQPSLPLELVA